MFPILLRLLLNFIADNQIRGSAVLPGHPRPLDIRRSVRGLVYPTLLESAYDFLIV